MDTIKRRYNTKDSARRLCKAINSFRKDVATLGGDEEAFKKSNWTKYLVKNHLSNNLTKKLIREKTLSPFPCHLRDAIYIIDRANNRLLTHKD